MTEWFNDFLTDKQTFINAVMFVAFCVGAYRVLRGMYELAKQPPQDDL